MPPKPNQTEQQPGAERFWGQFSQSKAGRSDAGNEAGTRDDPRADAGRSGDPNQNDQCLEWCPICRSAELFKNTVSPELKQQAESIQHEAVGVLKAFLDAYADKAGNGPGPAHGGNRSGPSQQEREEPASPRVTDIPLD